MRVQWALHVLLTSKDEEAALVLQEEEGSGNQGQ